METLKSGTVFQADFRVFSFPRFWKSLRNGK